MPTMPTKLNKEEEVVDDDEEDDDDDGDNLKGKMTDLATVSVTSNNADEGNTTSGRR